jgi:cytochrome oxidase Cu insertion factor (SCO1/SenC/PrrC family)
MKGLKQRGSAAEQGTHLERDRRVREYNYGHYRTGHFLTDLNRLVRGEGVRPGQKAPTFELESSGGDRISLDALRGEPVVLRFASFT